MTTTTTTTTMTTITRCSSSLDMVSSHTQRQDDPNDWRIRHRYFLSLGIMMNSKPFDVVAAQQQQQGRGQHEHDSIPAAAGQERLTSHRDPKGGSKNPHAESLPIYIISLKGDYGQVDQQIRSLPLVIEEEEEEKAALDPPIRNGSSIPSPTRNTLSGQAKLNSSHTLHGVGERRASSCSPGSSISFCPFVKVHEIPGRHMYSERLLRTLWMTPVESADSMRRNVIEFMAEGYVPEGVFDETDFMERDGKMVHPVCVLLDEPKNARLKQLYYMSSPPKTHSNLSTKPA